MLKEDYVPHVTQVLINSRRKQQKSYPSFGTDSTHIIDVTDSFIIEHENIDQNVELE